MTTRQHLDLVGDSAGKWAQLGSAQTSPRSVLRRSRSLPCCRVPHRHGGVCDERTRKTARVDEVHATGRGSVRRGVAVRGHEEDDESTIGAPAEQGRVVRWIWIPERVAVDEACRPAPCRYEVDVACGA